MFMQIGAAGGSLSENSLPRPRLFPLGYSISRSRRRVSATGRPTILG